MCKVGRRGGGRDHLLVNAGGGCLRTQVRLARAHHLGIEPKTPGWEQTSCPISPSGDLAPTQGGLRFQVEGTERRRRTRRRRRTTDFWRRKDYSKLTQ